MITTHFSDEIEYLVSRGNYYAFHSPERTLFPSDFRDCLLKLSHVANRLKSGEVDKSSILTLCEDLGSHLLTWMSQVIETYHEVEKKAVGNLHTFSEDLVQLSELLNKNLIHEDQTLEKVRKVDTYLRHLRRSEDVDRFCTISKEFPWLKDLIIEELSKVRAALMDQETPLSKVSSDLVKISEILDKTSTDLARESELFNEKLIKVRSELIGSKERLEAIKAKLIGDRDSSLAG